MLWDKKTSTIVNNESADIIRMFNSEFDDIEQILVIIIPKQKRTAIDDMNDYIYQNINNGVYRSGSATTQEAYNEAIETLFLGLDKLDSILSHQKYLIGDEITESDWRLLPTLLRFDSVYHGHFKCNKKKIKSMIICSIMRKSCINILVFRILTMTNTVSSITMAVMKQ